MGVNFVTGRRVSKLLNFCHFKCLEQLPKKSSLCMFGCDQMCKYYSICLVNALHRTIATTNHTLISLTHRLWLIGLVVRCSTRFAIFDANWAVWLLRCEVVWLCAESSTVSYRPKCLFVYLCSESTERIYHRKFFCGKNTAFVVIKYFYSRWVEFLCRSRNEYDSRRSGEGDGRRGEMGEGRRCANIIFLICTNPLEILHIIIHLSEEKKGVRGGGLEEKTGKKLLILTQIKLFETSPPPPLFWIIPPLS